LRRHFRRHERRTPGEFLWRVSLEGLLVTLTVAILAAHLGVESREIHPSQFPAFAFSAIFIAPLLETWLCQTLPVGAARLCGGGRRMQMAAAIVLFALPHFLVGLGTGLAAGIVGGFYYAFTYTHWRRHSLGRAYWMTAAQHTLHNLAVVVILIGVGM